MRNWAKRGGGRLNLVLNRSQIQCLQSTRNCWRGCWATCEPPRAATRAVGTCKRNTIFQPNVSAILIKSPQPKKKKEKTDTETLKRERWQQYLGLVIGISWYLLLHNEKNQRMTKFYREWAWGGVGWGGCWRRVTNTTVKQCTRFGTVYIYLHKIKRWLLVCNFYVIELINYVVLHHFHQQPIHCQISIVLTVIITNKY